MRGAAGGAAARRRAPRCGAWLYGAAVALAPGCRAAAAAAVAPAAGTAARGVASPTSATPADTVSAVAVTANASAEASTSAAAGTVASGTASATSASAANASTGGARAPRDCSGSPDCPVDCTRCNQGAPDLTRDARPGGRPTSVPREFKYSPGRYFRGMPDPLTESTGDRQRWQQEAMNPGYLSPGGDFVKNGPNELPPCRTKPQPSAAVARLAAAGAAARLAAALAYVL